MKLVRMAKKLSFNCVLSWRLSPLIFMPKSVTKCSRKVEDDAAIETGRKIKTISKT